MSTVFSSFASYVHAADIRFNLITSSGNGAGVEGWLYLMGLSALIAQVVLMRPTSTVSTRLALIAGASSTALHVYSTRERRALPP